MSIFFPQMFSNLGWFEARRHEATCDLYYASCMQVALYSLFACYEALRAICYGRLGRTSLDPTAFSNIHTTGSLFAWTLVAVAFHHVLNGGPGLDNAMLMQTMRLQQSLQNLATVSFQARWLQGGKRRERGLQRNATWTLGRVRACSIALELAMKIAWQLGWNLELSLMQRISFFGIPVTAAIVHAVAYRIDSEASLASFCKHNAALSLICGIGAIAALYEVLTVFAALTEVWRSLATSVSDDGAHILAVVIWFPSIFKSCIVVITRRSRPGSLLHSSGHHKERVWDTLTGASLGIGGLSERLEEICQRILVPRAAPKEVVRDLGIGHVRGILLYGPPGTGKTLLARQICKLLGSREPKIVHGPELLDQWLGQSERRLRDLFSDAEREWEQEADFSGLHVIIFDEIDAICRQRGSDDGGSGRVNDNMVNQLLTKLDGVNELNNILVIGTTNRKDLLDPALLRPGRLEAHMEIKLPDQVGRLEILGIHTKQMKERELLASEVDLEYLSRKTEGCSGADLCGIIRYASSRALTRHCKAGMKLQITLDDFEQALVKANQSTAALSYFI